MAKLTSYRKRANEKWKKNNPDKVKAYDHWYYENITKAKRIAKRASALKSRQSA